MTRAEQLARMKKRSEARLDKDKRVHARILAEQRDAARKARDARRQNVGTMADAAGLFVLDDDTLRGLMQCLVALVEMPNPVETLEGLMSTVVVHTEGSDQQHEANPLQTTCEVVLA
jgi:hypothetical protein